MTTEVELLPLYAELQGHPKIEIIKHYARANVARATTPLRAENERLRAEVERLKSMTAMTMGVGSGDGNLFVHGDYDSIKAVHALVFRAEQMEKALRLIESAKERGFGIDYARGVAQSVLAAQKQEGRTDG